MPDAKPNEIVFKALETALTLASERKWTSITLLEIAKTADIELKALYELNGRDAITDALDAWADQAMFEDEIDMDDLPRERLFEVIMRRFEAMEPYRSGVMSLMTARDKMPLRRTELLAARTRTARWALICSGLDTLDGAEETLTELGLVWVLRQAERAWRRDMDGSFAHTMAALDEELLRLQERIDRARGFFPSSLFTRANEKNEATEEGSMSPEAPQAETDPA